LVDRHVSVTKGITTSPQHLLEHRLVQRPVRDQLLQTAVLPLDLLETANFGDAHAGVGLLPAVEGRLDDANLAAGCPRVLITPPLCSESA
jgi:hypothetical protein